MSIKIIATNRKARHDYSILETCEAGIVLKGTEVKSLREGKVNLKESYVLIENEEAFLHNCHINPYSHGNVFNHEPLRKRKLLLHKREILKIEGKMAGQSLALVPLKIYFSRGNVKVEIGLARGKKLYDKRESLKKRSADREIERTLKDKNR